MSCAVNLPLLAAQNLQRLPPVLIWMDSPGRRCEAKAGFRTSAHLAILFMLTNMSGARMFFELFGALAQWLATAIDKVALECDGKVLRDAAFPGSSDSQRQHMPPSAKAASRRTLPPHSITVARGHPRDFVNSPEWLASVVGGCRRQRGAQLCLRQAALLPPQARWELCALLVGSWMGRMTGSTRAWLRAPRRPMGRTGCRLASTRQCSRAASPGSQTGRGAEPPACAVRARCSGIAPVLRACWSLGIPWVSLGYPLGIPWVSLIHAVFIWP